MARTYLYSPIPPLKTGTAHYFTLFINQIKNDKNEYVIVLDRKYYNKPKLYGYDVIDYRKVIRNPDDKSVYFLANNEFHRYCHRELFLHKKSDGMAISVIHEPAMWMNVYAMCSLGEYGFTKADLEYFGSYEFGDDTTFIVDQAINGKADYNFDYTSLAGTHIYEKSDVIVFHSYFAKNKFIAEKSPSYISNRLDEPKYLVMEHPPEKAKNVDTVAHRDMFIVGTYGWVKETKLTEQIIRGFDMFYKSLTAEEKSQARLDVVGEIDITKFFNPEVLANSLESNTAVSFYGYVSNGKMDSLMSESSVIFALRFPSCGETSGPVYKAKSMKNALVLSDYAAFAELPASHHITVDPLRVESEILRILKLEYKYFKERKPPTRTTVHEAKRYLGVQDMLVQVLELRDNV